jgi:hypothetical protein
MPLFQFPENAARPISASELCGANKYIALALEALQKSDDEDYFCSSPPTFIRRTTVTPTPPAQSTGTPERGVERAGNSERNVPRPNAAHAPESNNRGTTDF